MGFWQTYLVLAGVMIGALVLLWLLSLALKNSSIVDIFWGFGFIIFTWGEFLLNPDGFTGRKLLLNLLVTIWGLRLSLYILYRNWGKPEDFRYQQWRREAGASWWWYSLFKVFIVQGILLLIIAAPLLIVQTRPQPGYLIWLDYLAILVWLVGFTFEAGGDWQLMRFKANPDNKGKLLTTGLWRYTRHPNYFGDAAQWWAFYLFSLPAGGWWTVFSPLLMTGLLMRVSGVTLLEKTLKHTKPGYEEYVATTSEFFPWFPRTK